MYKRDNFISHSSIPDAGGYSTGTTEKRNSNLQDLNYSIGTVGTSNLLEFPHYTSDKEEIEQIGEYIKLFQVVRGRDFEIPDYEDDDETETLFVGACCIGSALLKAQEDGLYTVLSIEDFNQLVLI